jgi:hypothetical protein
LLIVDAVLQRTLYVGASSSLELLLLITVTINPAHKYQRIQGLLLGINKIVFMSDGTTGLYNGMASMFFHKIKVGVLSPRR